MQLVKMKHFLKTFLILPQCALNARKSGDGSRKMPSRWRWSHIDSEIQDYFTTFFFHSATLTRAANAWTYIFSWKIFFIFYLNLASHESRSAVVVDVWFSSDPMKERLPCFCLWKIFLVARWRGSRRRWKTTKIHEWKSFESFSRDIIARLLISRAFQRHRRSSFMWVSRFKPADQRQWKSKKEVLALKLPKLVLRRELNCIIRGSADISMSSWFFFAWFSRIQLKAADSRLL